MVISGNHSITDYHLEDYTGNYGDISITDYHLEDYIGKFLIGWMYL